MSSCLSIDMLERWASGELSSEEESSCEAHARDCDACRRRYEDSLRNQDFLAQAMPALAKARQTTPSAQVDEDAVTSDVPVTGDDSSDQDAPTQASPHPSPTPGSSTPPPGATPQYDIPGHEILRELHRGGQGVVYEALQQSTKRKVAIKVLLEGRYASEAARKRFEREVELVASLKHPNIIDIYHSGSTEEGHPYYVMDYVRGLPLHKHVRQSKLSYKQTLALFVRVCDAVSFAHKRGIIHRDLKPSNILVDGGGAPIVLDFGLARMVGGPDTTLVSRTGQVVGTLPYVSPEQARGIPDEIDTRTDVYALGVILYQLLTGHYPYPVVGDLMEVLRHITETPPSPPSKVWNADSGVQRAGERRSSGKIICPIDHEVETILLKALAKDASRRYQSVGELARDVEYYLAGKPIEAKRDSSFYILSKTLRRFRTPIGVSAVALTVVAAMVMYGLVQRGRYQAERTQREAGTIMSEFVADPAAGVQRAGVAAPRVSQKLHQMVGSAVTSAAYTDRVAGGRSALLVNPDAFWESVDGGQLWRHGEWLEVARVRWPDPGRVLGELRSKFQDGTLKQRYAALCLIGALIPHLDAEAREALADFCAERIEKEAHPGVIKAAQWAAARLDRDIAVPFSQYVIEDDISGLTFVRIPGTETFARGSSLDDPDRWSDEVERLLPEPVSSFHMATTEATLASFAGFVEDERQRDLFGPFDESHPPAHDMLPVMAARIRQLLEMTPPDERGDVPVSWISLDAGRRFCAWLSERSARSVHPWRYRLPTELEWEYAARAGGEGRYCYGDDDDYVSFFGWCEGAQERYRVGRRMPNYFGLSDMHGGLWEWTTTPYPADRVTDPKVTEELKKNLIIVKGGAWYSPAVRCRAAQRNYSSPQGADRYWGLRLVMEPVKP